MHDDHLASQTAQVHTAGQQVAGQSVDAASLASRYLSRLALAAGGVHHQQVTAAISRYRDHWQPVVHRVSGSIDALGNNTCSAAVEVALADEDSATQLGQQTLAHQAQATVLSRNPNAATYV